MDGFFQPCHARLRPSDPQRTLHCLSLPLFLQPARRLRPVRSSGSSNRTLCSAVGSPLAARLAAVLDAAAVEGSNCTSQIHTSCLIRLHSGALPLVYHHHHLHHHHHHVSTLPYPAIWSLSLPLFHPPLPTQVFLSFHPVLPKHSSTVSSALSIIPTFLRGILTYHPYHLSPCSALEPCLPSFHCSRALSGCERSHPIANPHQLRSALKTTSRLDGIVLATPSTPYFE